MNLMIIIIFKLQFQHVHDRRNPPNASVTAGQANPLPVASDIQYSGILNICQEPVIILLLL